MSYVDMQRDLSQLGVGISCAGNPEGFECDQAFDAPLLASDIDGVNTRVDFARALYRPGSTSVVPEGVLTGNARAYATALDQHSIDRYGFREDTETLSGTIYQTDVDAAAARRVGDTAWPTRVLGLTATNHPPGAFAAYGVGDAVACRLPSYGFGGLSGMFEVLGREFFPTDDTADLVLTEVT